MITRKTCSNAQIKLFVSCLTTMTVITFAGCGATKQPVAPLSTGVQDSGFLNDLYPLMHEGEKDQFMRVYRGPTVDALPADAYDKVMIENVMIYYGPESKLKDVPQDQLQNLATLFAASLAECLSKDYEVVEEKGPKTLSIQIALTDAQATSTTFKALSFVPWGIPGLKFAILKSKETMTGKPVFAGEVTAEGKISDSQSGDVLFAAVDRRVGARFSGGWQSWTDAEAAFKFWAEKIRYALCAKLRHQTDCVIPEE